MLELFKPYRMPAVVDVLIEAREEAEAETGLEAPVECRVLATFESLWRRGYTVTSRRLHVALVVSLVANLVAFGLVWGHLQYDGVHNSSLLGIAAWALGVGVGAMIVGYVRPRP